MSFKILLSTLTFSLTSCFLMSQAALNTFAKDFIKDYHRTIEKGDDISFYQFKVDYDLVPINGNQCIGVITLVDENALDLQTLNALAVTNDTKLQNLWTFRVPIQNFESFTQVSGIQFIEVGEPVSPNLEDARPSSRVDTVNQGLGDLLKAYNGQDVIIAVIDWGFDYTHPNFYDTSLTHLRLSRAWDQNKLSGPAPTGYNFGTEYLGQAELLGAESDTIYVFGSGSHGSHVAGIAGGSGSGTPHIGAASSAELIFISLRRDAPSLIDAFAYVANYAAQVNKPFVVNMSFGSHLGPHDGSSMKNLGIGSLPGPGKVFVGSAGNNGGSASPFHLDYDFSTNPTDTIRTVVGFNTGIAESFGQTLSMWGSAHSSFKVSLLVTSAFNDTLYQTPYYYSADEPSFIDTVLIASDTIIVRVQSSASYFLNNKPNIRMEVKKTSGSQKVVLHATSEDSHLHIWNNVRMNNRYTNWGVSLLTNFPGSIGGNHAYGLGEPAGVGKNVITVGSHVAETYDNGFVFDGQISGFSSNGPTVDERVKPDITSVGSNVMSSVNSFDSNVVGNYSVSVSFNGKTFGFQSFSGTSMSGPLVTGIVALMLEAFPNMSAVQAKEILKNTARLDNNTGNIGPGGDLTWGWGKANALAAVKAAEIMSSTDDITIQESFFDVYPNPAQQVLNIKLEENEKAQEIEIIPMDGKAGKKFYEFSSNTIQLDISDLPKGVYLLKVQTKNRFAFERIIVQ